MTMLEHFATMSPAPGLLAERKMANFQAMHKKHVVVLQNVEVLFSCACTPDIVLQKQKTWSFHPALF